MKEIQSLNNNKEYRMNIKHYSTTLLCALFLTACGGSGDSKDQPSKTNSVPDTPNDALSAPEFEQWIHIDIEQIDSSEVLNYNINTTTLAQGKLYLGYDSEDSTFIDNNSFSVSANGYYEDGPVHSIYGVLQGNIRTNLNTWEIHPYSPIQSTDLTMTMQHRQKDVSGKNIAELFAPFEYLELKHDDQALLWLNDKEKAFYNAIYKTTFPAGSRCIQIQSLSNSVAYADLSLNSLADENQTTLKSNWTAASQNADYRKFNFKDTVAYIDHESSTGIAQYKDKYYYASYQPAGKEYDLDDVLMELKSDIHSETDPNIKSYYEEAHQLLSNTCQYFNKTAADAISKHLK